MTDAIRDELEELYSDIFKEEGYYMVASAPIYIPYYCCEMQCKYIQNQTMTSLDIVIGKCLEKDIRNAEDISFVIALDKDIIKEVLNYFEQKKLLYLENNNYYFSATGKEAFQQQKKISLEESNIMLYENGITGEYFLEKPIFHTELIEKDAILLETDVMIQKEEINKDVLLYKEIDKKYNIKIQNINLSQNQISYYEEYVLFYQNEEDNMKFQIYDIQKQCFDLNLTKKLLQKYEKRRLYEIIKVEKILQNSKKLLEEYKTPINHYSYYRNKELRELFKNVFQIAEKSIYIVSPWIDNNNFVMTKTLIQTMEKALSERNIKITIGYGYLSKDRMKSLMEAYEQKRKVEAWEMKDINTELKARELKEYFKNYSNFSMKYIGTHEKILCYDERFILIGSFNFLSYDGGEKVNYGGNKFRLEGGVFIEDAKFAKYVIEKLEE